MTAAATASAAPAYVPGELTVHRDPATMSRVSAALRSTGRRVVLVPTMGALHEGHLTLVREARKAGNTVVVVVDLREPAAVRGRRDLDAYPRTFDEDCAKLREIGVELVLRPPTPGCTPMGDAPRSTPGRRGDPEAQSRPTHFIGMLTVVAKLLGIVAPNAAYFGEGLPAAGADPTDGHRLEPGRRHRRRTDRPRARRAGTVVAQPLPE